MAAQPVKPVREGSRNVQTVHGRFDFVHAILQLLCALRSHRTEGLTFNPEQWPITPVESELNTHPEHDGQVAYCRNKYENEWYHDDQQPVGEIGEPERGGDDATEKTFA